MAEEKNKNQNQQQGYVAQQPLQQVAPMQYGAPVPGIYQHMAGTPRNIGTVTYTAEDGDEELLRDKSADVVLNITAEEAAANRCVHKDRNGISLLRPIETAADGTPTKFRCSRCGSIIDLAKINERDMSTLINALDEAKMSIDFYRAISLKFDGEAMKDAVNGLTYCKKILTVLPRLIEQSNREGKFLLQPAKPFVQPQNTSDFDRYNGILNGTYRPATNFMNMNMNAMAQQQQMQQPMMYQQQMQQFPQPMGGFYQQPMAQQPVNNQLMEQLNQQQAQIQQLQQQLSYNAIANGAGVQNPFAEQQPPTAPVVQTTTLEFGK